MINLDKYKINEFPLKLKFIKDLIYYDGSLLTLFENDIYEKYLYYWCDVDENCNRWMVIKINDKLLNKYLINKITLKDLIIKPIDKILYIVDIDNLVKYKNVYLIKPHDLPNEYIPDSDSYFD